MSPNGSRRTWRAVIAAPVAVALTVVTTGSLLASTGSPALAAPITPEVAPGAEIANGAPLAALDDAIVITTTMLPSVEVGEPFAVQLDVSGGAAPYQWGAATLPAGVTITSGGLLAGVPTSAGTQSVEVSVLDATDDRADAALTLDVSPGPTVTTSSLPEVLEGSAYSVQLGATGGTSPYSWSIVKGGLPGGLVLSSTGLLSGRPGTAGTSSIDLQVSDAVGASSQALLTFTVEPVRLAPEGYATADAAGRTQVENLVATASSQNAPGKTVALAVEPSGSGYWTVTSAGRVHAFGAARNFGSIGRRYLRGVVVGIAAPLGSTGYWIATSTGHVYGFGSVRSLGSLDEDALPAPVVGIAATGAGRGYWLVTANGRVYGFGAAQVIGWVPKRALRGTIVAIAASHAVPGYLLASSTGRVYGFGRARPLPPTAGPVSGTVVGVATPIAPAGAGYWLLTASGAVFAYGAAREIATSPPQPISIPSATAPAVGIAAGR